MENYTEEETKRIIRAKELRRVAEKLNKYENFHKANIKLNEALVLEKMQKLSELADKSSKREGKGKKPLKKDEKKMKTLRSEIFGLRDEITELKRNKRGSKHYEFKATGVNRRMRRYYAATR